MRREWHHPAPSTLELDTAYVTGACPARECQEERLLSEPRTMPDAPAGRNLQLASADDPPGLLLILGRGDPRQPAEDPCEMALRREPEIEGDARQRGVGIQGHQGPENSAAVDEAHMLSPVDCQNFLTKWLGDKPPCTLHDRVASSPISSGGYSS